MTPEERKKLVEEITWKIVDGVTRGYHWPYKAEQVIAEQALNIAQAAFAKEIEAAYKEGWQTGCSITRDPSVWEEDWQHSHSRAAILASIPEKKDD